MPSHYLWITSCRLRASVNRKCGCQQIPVAGAKQLGYFPRQIWPYERLTVREQVRYFGELHGLQAEQLEHSVDNVIERLDIASLADRKSAGFSQGQRMKVALAQALVHNPKHLILDEPSRGLDVMSTRILRDILREQRAAGTRILFSSHVMQEVALCDRVVVMAAGKVAAEGMRMNCAS